MRTFLRDNGLTIALLTCFAVFLCGQLVAGWLTQNEELLAHGRLPMTLGTYAMSADFVSAVFENWESEFLQMSAYVVMTAILFQRGSAESRDPDDPEAEEDGPPARLRRQPLRYLYEHSLGLALILLFLASFVIHWLASARVEAEEAAMHGRAVGSALDYLLNARLWFESLQNWQSEFLSTAVLVVLTIFLRQRGSPESKSVDAPHARIGK